MARAAARWISLAFLLLIGPGGVLGGDQAIRVDKNWLKEAIESAKRKAEAGDADAQYFYGTLFGEDGAAEAAKWFLRAAKQDHAKAQARIGVMYDIGSGVARDPEAAVTWLTRAAANGQKFAQYYVWMKYKDGEDLPVDASLARKWLQMAAEQNHAPAQYQLALLLQEQDWPQALRWARASGGRGYAPAQRLAGELLNRVTRVDLAASRAPWGGPAPRVALRPEVERERAEVMEWYLAAAEGGDVSAQYYVAGKVSDPIEAFKWYVLVVRHLAANPPDSGEFPDVNEKGDKSFRSLSPQDRDEAARRIKQWIAGSSVRNARLKLLMEGV